VSEHVDEILLGLSFLEENACIWNFSKRCLSITGKQIRPVAHKPTNGVRRIVLQEETILLPRCQQTVAAKTVYSSLAKSTANWVTRPTEITAGVGMARTLVIDRPEDVHVRVVNTNDYEVRLEKGTNLGLLEEVEQVELVTSTTAETHEDMKYLAEVISRIDASVLVDDKTAFVFCWKSTSLSSLREIMILVVQQPSNTKLTRAIVDRFDNH
jgi:hypothetical protein